MSQPVRELDALRAARDRARAEFRRRLGLAQVDLAPVVLKRRALDEAQRTAQSAAYRAIDIANDSRGIVAATVALVVIWLGRKPIGAAAGRLVRRFRRRKSPPARLGNRFKLVANDYWQRLKEYADD